MFASFSFYFLFLSLSTLSNGSGKDPRNNKSIVFGLSDTTLASVIARKYEFYNWQTSEVAAPLATMFNIGDAMLVKIHSFPAFYRPS